MEEEKPTGYSKENREQKESRNEGENVERKEDESCTDSAVSRTNSYRSDLSQDIDGDNGVSNHDPKNVRPRREAATARRRHTRPKHGRVQKRKPHHRARRHKQRNNKRERRISFASVLTRNMSSNDASEKCKYCGHRIPRRRSKKPRRHVRRVKRVRFRKNPPRYKKAEMLALGKKCVQIQVGPQSLALSPLCIKTNCNITDEQPSASGTSCSCCEISPEMICETLSNMTKWRQTVTSVAIMNDLKRHYPVQADNDKLLDELQEKLRIATIVGIVESLPNDHWGPQCEVTRRLPRTLVTEFWKIYLDTMKPLRKQQQIT